MYQVDKDTKISADLIEDAIQFNERHRERFDRLGHYYLGDQDIMHREKSDTLMNNHVMVNHAKYIVDVSVGYLLGSPVDYQTEEGVDITALLDTYHKQCELNAHMIIS